MPPHGQQAAANGAIGGAGVLGRNGFIEERAAGGMTLKNVPASLQRAQAQMQAAQCLRDEPQDAIRVLVQMIEKNICEETHKMKERIDRIRCMVFRGGMREEHDAIREEEARYLLVTAPMRKQRDYLINQLAQLHPIAPIVATAQDYEVEEARDAAPKPQARKKR